MQMLVAVLCTEAGDSSWLIDSPPTHPKGTFIISELQLGFVHRRSSQL